MNKLVLSLGVCALMANAETADDVLKRWDVAAKDFHAFSADIQKTEYTAALKLTRPSTAILRLKRADKGVVGIVRFTDENPHTFHFAGDKVEDFKPGANQMDVYDAKKFSGLMRDVLMLGFGTSGKDVKNTYTVKDLGPEMVGSRRTTRIELIPKDQRFRDYAAKIEVWVPEGETNPIQVKDTQPKGNYDLYVYSNVKLLKLPLKDADFDFDADQQPNKSTHINKL